MPLIATRGAASAQGFGEFAQASAPVYVEEVFSTYLYTGTGASLTITNNIDLSTKGGLVWIKDRTLAENHNVFDTARGAGYQLITNETGAQGFDAQRLSAFTTSGFSLGTRAAVNQSGSNFVSWTFRKQPKFFDIQTYTGAGSVDYSHSLGAVPGFALYKATNGTSNWNCVCRKSDGTYELLQLNTTASTFTTYANAAAAGLTATTFNPSAAGSGSVGTQFVAYLFAHDAGGFGLTGTDNVISCGSYTGTGAVGNAVTLGYEPQWLMVKNVTEAGDWIMYDNMRGMPASDVNTGNTKILRPNLSNAESGGATIAPTATGFVVNTTFAAVNTTGNTFIYIAIRRGPMKVPTTGTSVFAPVAYTGTGAAATTTTGLVTDLAIIKSRGVYAPSFEDRLRGANRVVESSSPTAEITTTQYVLGFDVQTGVRIGTDVGVNGSGTTYINWAMRRAPGFFDEVCYTGTGSYPFTINHNLGVVPELIIFRVRNGNDDWYTYANPITSPNSNWYQNFVRLNQTAASGSDLTSFTSAPTSTTIPVASYYSASATTYAVYLFATCPGVSKVGGYTGTGTTQTINCGFTAGARFVLIKRTDSTGDWYVWDSARGIIAGNDPYLLLNSTAAEVTGTDYVDTANSGFEISSTAPAAINANGGTYIFLAIA